MKVSVKESYCCLNIVTMIILLVLIVNPSYALNISLGLIKDHQEMIPELAELWYENMGKDQHPALTIEQFKVNLKNNLNEESLPLTFVTIDNGKAVGMVSLVASEGIVVRSDLSPRLRSLVVAPAYRRQGIGKKQIDAVKYKAWDLGYKKLYLFTIDSKLVQYYSRLGWHVFSNEELNGRAGTIMEIELDM